MTDRITMLETVHFALPNIITRNMEPEPTTGCWLWTGNMRSNGYPQVNISPYRYTFELVHGAIPHGLHLDHLCRTPACVNPGHLEAVTPAENQRRKSFSIDVCKNGHPRVPERTYVHANRPNRRVCMDCQKESQQRIRDQRKAARCP